MDSTYTNILVAVDLGPQSSALIRKAYYFAQKMQCQLHVLFVIEPAFNAVRAFAEQQSQQTAHIESATKQFVQLHHTLKDIPFAHHCEVGNPENQILLTAKKLNCGLICVGDQGMGGSTHLLGSTSHYIINHAEQDVLVLHVKDLLKNKTIPTRAPKFEAQIPQHKVQTQWQKGPTFIGSEHGFGEEVSHGPKPHHRPKSSPYRGGTRHPNDKTEDEDES